MADARLNTAPTHQHEQTPLSSDREQARVAARLSVAWEQLGPCKIACADSFEVLPTLRQIDQFITDPPYAAKTHKGALTTKNGHQAVLLTFDCLSDERFAHLLSLMLERCQEWIVMTCDYRHAALCYDLPEFIRLGAWFKPNPMPQISADRPGQGFETIAILHAGKERKRWNRGGEAGTWTHLPERDGEQATQKPLSLVLDFVTDFTQHGQTVCDPFMGSGTTAIACIRTGRQFIGIEKDPGHYATARARILRELSQPMLIPPTAEKHEQTPLFADTLTSQK